MEKASLYPSSFKAYTQLTKPGIVCGNALTATAGYALASRGQGDLWLFLSMVVGLSLIIASACVFNNYIDRETDKKMLRTRNRPLAQGVISPRNGLFFAFFLGLCGSLVLGFFTYFLALAVALFGLLVYVAGYSFFKYRSMHATLLGSIAGATPPVVGYCAVSHRLDADAGILFALLLLWQMPHFFAIALYRLEDYAAASIPLFPLKKGVRLTKIHMLFYILAFIAVSLLLPHKLSLPIAFLGFVWGALCLSGFKCAQETRWARKMFLFSLVVIVGMCLWMILNTRLY